jgi:ubiquinone/menaquinone biosynthesis C-methylase UbiE
MQAAEMYGLDVASKAIEHCKKHNTHANLTFLVGDAGLLPFPDEHFDAIVNVEASHAYPNRKQFFAEVHRVLKPGGHLLIADCRDNREDQLNELAQTIDSLNFTISYERDITQNVYQSCLHDTQRRQALLHRMPAFVRPILAEYAAIEGSDKYTRFKTGDIYYFLYVLTKK